MNKMKTRSGFSLVEMMLLLLVTSLMLASAVTIITKKHVKVPKITMHGAYMCYMKNGTLHEEQYVGSNLRKKILDQDVAACNFTPPERASYLYVQAIGGGGGGGDSGYTGGDNLRFESATEVISPFGITQALLTLKGIPNTDFNQFGGSVYAYAMAEGAGNGGDLYYIKEDCKDTCLQWREWEYTGNEEVDCSCETKEESYEVFKYNYDLSDNCASDCCKTCTHINCCAPPVDYPCKKTVNCEWMSDTTCLTLGTGKPCKGPNGENITRCGSKEIDSTCTDNCPGEKIACHQKDCFTANANECGTHICNENEGSCETYSVPSNTFEDTKRSFVVRADDRYTQDWENPKHMYETTAATGTTEKGIRDVKRDEQTTFEICNYGNPAKFTGVSDGIFGTFMKGEVPVECQTGPIMNAFGDDIFPMGIGYTLVSRIGVKSSKEVYGGDGLKYDKSESNTNSYGQRCVNDAYDGTCDKYILDNNVSGVHKTLVDGYKVTDMAYTPHDNCPNPDSYDNGSLVSNGSYNSSNTVYGDGSSYCSCPKTNSNGTECMLSKNLCSYIPAKASGGTAGSGTSCRTNSVNAAIGLNYVGNSSVVPGIRGSDINCTGDGYKALYSEWSWDHQPSCYAENGTDAQGSSVVTITGGGANNSCTANAVAPTKGQGARKTSTGSTTGTDGASSTTSGTTILVNATNGAGCGDQHVGYCLTRKNGGTDADGKYTYKYTWTTNYLQYGEGGKAGQYRAMVVRTALDRPLAITIGRGGAGGANETGEAGADGGITVVGDIVRAEGGKGGPGGFLTPTEQLPNWHAGGTFQKGWNGTLGESANVNNFKANILNLVLPIDNSILGQWLAASGAGGDGGGSRNNCWASEWMRWFEGYEVSESIAEGDITCRSGRNIKYWSATPNATDGMSGAVLIKW